MSMKAPHLSVLAAFPRYNSGLMHRLVGRPGHFVVCAEGMNWRERCWNSEGIEMVFKPRVTVCSAPSHYEPRHLPPCRSRTARHRPRRPVRATSLLWLILSRTSTERSPA